MVDGKSGRPAVDKRGLSIGFADTSSGRNAILAEAILAEAILAEAILRG